MGAGLLVYFSSKSENTHRFVAKTGLPARRIPLRAEDDSAELKVNEPYVLVVPTYADGEGKGAVPKPVIRFLNDADNRAHLRGVIAGGNRNFGHLFAGAGDVIARRCGVPCLYRFELPGTDEDVEKVQQGIRTLWQRWQH